MIDNPIRRLWKQERPALNGWLSMPCAFSAEIMAQQGYDSVCIDMQHGMIDHQACVDMLRAMRASGVTPLVRAAWLEPAAVMKPLDAGALGIICPMIESADDARRLVSYARYAPEGARSIGPTRAIFAHGADYPTQANAAVLCIAMIETARALDNLEDIVAVEGVDAVYVGPSDLTLSLHRGRLPAGFDREEPEMIEAIRRVLDAAHAAGIRAALHCGTPDYAARAIGWGFDMTTLPNDVRLLAGAAKASVDRTRTLLDAG